MELELAYRPTGKQLAFHASTADEVLYGGAAGGGKSYAICWDALIGMKSGAYAFCLYYYICGMNLEDGTRMTDRCERQIRRYKREIEKGNEENGEAD